MRAYTVRYTAPGFMPYLWYSSAGGFGQVLVTPARYELETELTAGEAERLARDPGHRGSMSYEAASGSLLTVSGIELTEGEARQLADGADPLDVLFPVWPEYGYRLVAVPVTNLGGT